MNKPSPATGRAIKEKIEERFGERSEPHPLWTLRELKMELSLTEHRISVQMSIGGFASVQLLGYKRCLELAIADKT